MTQTIIHKQINRTSSGLKLSLQNGQVFCLPLNFEFHTKLHLGDTLDSRQIQELSKASLRHILTEYALRQIAISPKNKLVLKQKVTQKAPAILAKYGYSLLDSDQIISEVVDYLEAKNLLNELDFATYLLSRHKNKSIFFQKRILQQKGVSQEIISNLIGKVDQQNQLVLMRNLVIKYRLRYQNLPKFQQNQKILNLLYQKGFPISLAKPIVDQTQKKR